MTITAILPLPAGFAERRETVFAPVAGISPLIRVVAALEKRCDVVVAAADALTGAVRETLAEQSLSGVQVVEAAPTGGRTQCVQAGLRGLSGGDHVVVHDIEWPIVGVATLDRIIATLRGGAAAVMPTRPVTDSVKVIDADGLLATTLDRSRLRSVQYPRGFTAEMLGRLVNRSASSRFDELEAAFSEGAPLTLIEGDDESLRVELPYDAGYLAALIKTRPGLPGP